MLRSLSQRAPCTVPTIAADIPEEEISKSHALGKWKRRRLSNQAFWLPILVTDAGRLRSGGKDLCQIFWDGIILWRLSWMTYVYGIRSLEKCFIILSHAACNDALWVLKALLDVKLCPAWPAVCSLKSHTNELITCNKNRLWKQSKKCGK